ncbi:MAG: hypothetical protein OHK0039_39200 [Bacteroidia bacterium]
MAVPVLLWGQAPCGTDAAAQRSWLARYTAHLRQPAPAIRDLRQVPVAFHLVGRSNGAGRVAVGRVLDLLCELNTTYAPVGMWFYLAEDGIGLPDDDGVFTQPLLATSRQRMRSWRQDSALNVYVVSQAGSAGVLGYYDAQDDWVVVRRDAIRPDAQTLAHEIGHFFSLLHPHFGWDGAAWQAQIHGNPAPALASDLLTPTERMDSSNCDTAADMLCDTRPDYNFGLGWQQNCAYAGGALDPDSVLVDPDETLVMSYFGDACRGTFSPQQIALMQSDWADPARAYLHRAAAPLVDTLAGVPLPVAPVGTGGVSGGALSFVWRAVAGATGYWVECDRSPSFDLDPTTALVADTSATLTADWQFATTYYWRVRAFSTAYTCAAPATPSNFVPAQALALGDAATRPRIEATADPLVFFLQLPYPAPHPLTCELTDLAGRVCWRQSLAAAQARHRIALPSLPPGSYVLCIDRWPSVLLRVQR